MVSAVLRCKEGGGETTGEGGTAPDPGAEPRCEKGDSETAGRDEAGGERRLVL